MSATIFYYCLVGFCILLIIFCLLYTVIHRRKTAKKEKAWVEHYLEMKSDDINELWNVIRECYDKETPLDEFKNVVKPWIISRLEHLEHVVQHLCENTLEGLDEFIKQRDGILMTISETEGYLAGLELKKRGYHIQG